MYDGLRQHALFVYKFTGKERDTESGLDNFGRRYHASSLGRFMTPDPIGVMKQKLIDPQQWNMYAYVRNNPLRFTDPTGMYTCNGTQSQCDRIKAAYDAAQKALAAAKKGSDQYKQLSSVLKFLGKPGEANYVSVTFGSLKPGTLGQANTTTSAPDLLGNTHKNTEIKFDLNQVDQTAKLNRRTPLWAQKPHMMPENLCMKARTEETNSPAATIRDLRLKNTRPR